MLTQPYTPSPARRCLLRQVCAALKVLAGENSFQDVATFSGMSVTTAEASFHLFCNRFAAALWDTWVKLPVGDALKKVEEVFWRSGYPGAMGSTDCTHFKWAGGPFSEARLNTGKEGYPYVAVEATCDHTGVGSLRLAIVLLPCLPWYLIFLPS